MYPTTHLGYMV